MEPVMKKLIVPLTCLALLAASATSTAASLFVRPTTVVIARGENAASVTITNSGTAPITAQVRVFAWDQAANEDQLTPTEALAASPPMAMIPPGQSQTVRLVRVSGAAAAREESYRLLVDEIPDRSAAAAGGNVTIQLRYSVPVFVRAANNPSARLDVNAAWVTDSLRFEAANRGQAHAQISNISLQYADGSSVVVGEGLVGYVLPDKNRLWWLALPDGNAARGKPDSVRAVVNGQELSVRL
jgi:fimbrial chaperone protein